MAANDVNDVVTKIFTLTAEEMKRIRKIRHGDKLMLKLKIRPMHKPATKGKAKAEASVVSAKPAAVVPLYYKWK